MSLHSFDPDVAKRVGVNAAVIYQNIIFWAEKNMANRKHIMDGLVWTYNSRRAFSELFSYLSESQVKTSLEKLVKSGLLLKGEYNQANYDKTNWYAPASSVDWVNSAIGQKSPMDWSEISNGLVNNRQPIPDTKPYTKPVKEVGQAAPDPDPPIPKKMRLPPDWVPDQEMTEFALSKKLHHDDIKEMANDFHTYWIEQPKAKSTKSAKGWQATWRNNVNRIGWQYIRNRSMAGNQVGQGRGQGGSIASIVAQRRLSGQD